MKVVVLTSAFVISSAYKWIGITYIVLYKSLDYQSGARMHAYTHSVDLL